MTRLAAATLTLLLPALAVAEPAAPAAPPAEAAQAPVPVRVRVIKGSRQGPASLPASMAPLKQQLSKLAYQRWEQLERARLHHGGEEDRVRRRCPTATTWRSPCRTPTGAT